MQHFSYTQSLFSSKKMKSFVSCKTDNHNSVAKSNLNVHLTTVTM